MDPLSIAGGVLSLVSSGFKISRSLNTLRNKYKSAPATLSALSVECSVTCAALYQIQDLLTSRPEFLTSQSDSRSMLTDMFELALLGCAATFSVLDEELTKVEYDGKKGVFKVGFKSRLKLIWNEDTLKELLQQMRDQRSSIGFLIETVQTEKLTDIQQQISTLKITTQRAKSYRLTRGQSVLRGHCADDLEKLLNLDNMKPEVYSQAVPSRTYRKRSGPKSSPEDESTNTALHRVSLHDNPIRDVAPKPKPAEQSKRVVPDTETIHHFHDAVKRSDLQQMRTFLAKFPSLVGTVSPEPGIKPTPLYRAVDTSKVETVDLLLQHGAIVDHGINNGKTPLNRAAERGYLDIVKLLLQHGAAIEGRDDDGVNSVIFAAANGRLEVMKLLLDKGARIDVADNCNQQAIHAAIVCNEPAIVELLLTRGAPMEDQTQLLSTPLFVATKYDRLECARILLEAGAKVNARCVDDFTPIFEAQTTLMINSLIDHGADLGAVSVNGNTPLHHAAWLGRIEAAKAMLDHGAKIEARNNLGRTPLMVFPETDDPSFCKFLLSRGAFLEASDDEKNTPLILALHYEKWSRAEYLIDAGANVSATNVYGTRPLHLAAREGNIPIVKRLLSKGVNINAQVNTLETPIFLAVKNGHFDMVSFLYEQGAKTDIRASDEVTLLHTAAEHRRTAIAKSIIERGWFPVDVKDGAERLTALHYASAYDASDTAKMLLKKGANIDCRDLIKRTPLHWAAGLGNLKTAKLLVEKDAMVDATNKWNATPLWLATELGKTAVVAFLLECGADPTIRTNPDEGEGYTALEIARIKGWPEIVELLEKAGP